MKPERYDVKKGVFKYGGPASRGDGSKLLAPTQVKSKTVTVSARNNLNPATRAQTSHAKLSAIRIQEDNTNLNTERD